jgi:hypothetical protein
MLILSIEKARIGNQMPEPDRASIITHLAGASRFLSLVEFFRL